MATVYQDVVQAEIQRIQMVKQLIAHQIQFSLKVISFSFNLGNSGHRHRPQAKYLVLTV